MSARRRQQPEQRLQRAIVAHLKWRAAPDCFWLHHANGKWRSAVEGAIFKSIGVRPGVPDLILIHRARNFALEIKTERGRLTAAQAATHEAMRAAGATVATAVGIDDALAALERWHLLRSGPAPVTGWPAQIASEVAAAPDRTAAQQLIEAHSDAIAALLPSVREHLLATLQDLVQELEFRHACESVTAALPSEPERSLK